MALVGNYLPRKCGIATFTADLRSCLAAVVPETDCAVVPVNNLETGYDYPPEVRYEVPEQDHSAYRRAADFLNFSNVDVVSLQHEFGIFGGASGAHVLTFLREIKAPVVTTLHTILQTPSPEQRRVMNELVQRSARLVVMTRHGRDLLETIYHVSADKIDIIPHGIPEVPFADPNFFKDLFGVEGKQVLLTFGLLSPGKGIEYVLNALPAITAEFPDVVYIVLGATHPNLVREQGEAYRLSLERLAKKNKIQRHVVFYDRFVSQEELTEFLGATDIYVTPYLNEAQITSGTLAYAFGTGKAVVSTPYWHAKELLAEDRGLLVPFGDSQAIAEAVLSLLRDETRRHALRKNAYKLGREMIWSQVARQYLRAFERARAERAKSSRRLITVHTLDQQSSELPDLKLDHLVRMTDGTGLLQHAVFSLPNYSEGYTTDDNARALLFTVLLEELGEDAAHVRTLATTYGAFVHHAFNPAHRRFRNFLSFDRRWLEEFGSEDSHGRALYALGACVGRSRRQSFQAWAGHLFQQALPVAVEFAAPRAWALTLLAIHEYSRRLAGDRLACQTREALTARLMRGYAQCATDGWCWCEDILTYDNARLAHALIVSGHDTGQDEVVTRGLAALRWLMEIQTAPEGHFRPVGCRGFYPRGQARALFDQQPIEACASLSACLAAFRVTGESVWSDQADRVFDWFLGGNDLGLELYAPNTGGCYDGLEIDRVNQNQGAESTLAYLLASAEMRLTQNELGVVVGGANGSPLAASELAKSVSPAVLREVQTR